MVNRLFLSLFLLLAMPLSVLAEAGGQTYEAGKDYDVITPAIRTADPHKIEVTEFFWYGCGHCYAFEPLLEQWEKGLPEDVSFRGSPAMWNARMEVHARIYYVAEVLGVLDTLHAAAFQAMNVDHKPLATEAEIGQLFVANGVSAEDFTKAFNSFGVGSEVRQANARARAAKIDGTPTLMVDGKYRISTRKAGNQANMLKIADFLIAKERAARASKAS